MNQKFFNISLILHESRLSYEDKKHLWKLSYKLAVKGIHKITNKSEEKYNRKRIRKKIKNDTQKIYNQLLQKSEEPL